MCARVCVRVCARAHLPEKPSLSSCLEAQEFFVAEVHTQRQLQKHLLASQPFSPQKPEPPPNPSLARQGAARA